ncbi:hypothetical protein [Deinococcus sonorensis]|uniref:Asparagine synthetase domain-containing protein n=2 Tax=Deinococcus sonorensis TaxID=309891 RepID=A0AAU7UCB1_9DEIO
MSDVAVRFGTETWTRPGGPAGEQQLVLNLHPPVPGESPGGWQVEVHTCAGIQVQRAPDGLTLLLKGLVDWPPEELFRRYRAEGVPGLRGWWGTYTFVLLDPARGEVYVGTDATASRKMYASVQGGRLWLSTSLRGLAEQAAFRAQPFSRAGVAAYLASGQMPMGHTLMAGVQRLERDRVYRLGVAGGQPTLEVAACDTQHFAVAPVRDGRALKEELNRLLLASAQRHWASCGPRPAVSLSAGVDARALLGLLGGDLKARGITAFSYSLGTPVPGSDPALSPQLAAHYGYPHVLVNSYRGQLLDTLQRNAVWGDGGSNICDEVDAWDELASLGYSDVFTGDHVYGWNGEAPAHQRDFLLHQLGLPRWDALGALQPVLDPHAWTQLGQDWMALRAEQEALGGPLYPPLNFVDQLYLESRVQHTLVLWREHFSEQGGRVHLPYLDPEMIAFVKRLPPEWRDHKRLFRELVQQRYPGLFALPFATSLGYKPDWNAELQRHRAAVQDELRQPAPRLDELLPPDRLAQLLDRLTPAGAPPRFAAARTRLATVRRSALGTRLLGEKPSRATVPPATLLMRALTLRAFERSLNLSS